MVSFYLKKKVSE